MDNVVKNIINGTFDEKTLMDLKIAANSPASSKALVQAIISEQVTLGVGPEEAISTTLGLLEKLPVGLEPTTCILMNSLQPFANELRMHDVCDAVDLWISHYGNSKRT